MPRPTHAEPFARPEDTERRQHNAYPKLQGVLRHSCERFVNEHADEEYQGAGRRCTKGGRPQQALRRDNQDEVRQGKLASSSR